MLVAATDLVVDDGSERARVEGECGAAVASRELGEDLRHPLQRRVSGRADSASPSICAFVSASLSVLLTQ